MLRIFHTLLFCFVAISLSAQQRTDYLYPIKKGHKWGYMDKRGNIVIEPKYDAVGDQPLRYTGRQTESPYRLVETAGKLGLIDAGCDEVLPANYDYIAPLNAQHFIIKQDTSTKVISLQGGIALRGEFQDIRLLDTMDGHFFKVKIGDLWGVHTMEQGEVLPPVYEDIQLLRSEGVFFKTKKPGRLEGWGLTNPDHRSILPGKFDNIRCLGPGLFATLETGLGWTLRDFTGQAIMQKKWTGCIPLNQELVGLTEGLGITYLFSVSKKDTLALEQQFPDYRPFNDQFVLYRSGLGYGLMDNNGAIVTRPDFNDFIPAFDSLFKVHQRWRGWGVLSLKRGLVAPCIYDDIREQDKKWIRASRADLWGLLDSSFQEVVPFAFDRLVIADTLIKAYENNQLTLFKVTKNGQVALMDEFENVQTLRVGFATKVYQEAIPLKEKARARSVLDEEASPFTAQSEGRWIWFRDTDSQRWALKDMEKGSELVVPPSFVDVLHLKKPKLSMVLTDSEVTENNGNLSAAFPSIRRFFRAAIFSHKTGKFITPFGLLAIRGGGFDQNSLAVFLDKNGHFGLMDAEGNEKGQRFTWIGEFKDGMARFCQGGRLALAEEGKQSKKGLGRVGEFMVLFGLHTTQNFGYIQDRQLTIENTPNSPARWGYIDLDGKVILEAQFDYASDFENGYAVNEKDGQWGVIGIDGKAQLPFSYNSVSPFHGHWLVGVKSNQRLVFNPNGYERITKLYRRQGSFSENRCQVQMDSLWGFIDEEGYEVIPCQFEEARAFSEELAAVLKEGKWGFIDKNGISAFDIASPEGDISEVGDFSDGLAWIKVGHKYGYINRQGELAIPMDFTRVFGFKFGVARAVFRGKTGLIDTTGQWILKPERFEYITDFNQWGVAEAREKYKGQRCLINAKGEVLTPLKYWHIGEFHEGFAAIGDGQFFGLLNTRGKEVLPIQYEAIGQVSEGLLTVRPRNSTHWQFLDTLGNSAFEGEFVKADPFQYGHSFVQESLYDPASRYVINREGQRLNLQNNDQFEFYESGIFGLHTPFGERDGFRRMNYYYADATGKRLFDRLFEKIQPYKGDVALIQESHRWGMINRNGLFVLPPKYPFVNMQDNGEAIVSLPVLFGLLDLEGREIFPPEFDHIQLMQGNLFRVEMGEKVGYAKMDGEWVWPLGK